MTTTIAKAVNGRKFIFRWNLNKMFADKMLSMNPDCKLDRALA